VPDLYRVFPYRAASRQDEPGAALFVPPQGGGRIDNPGTYDVLYMSDSAAGAIAEAFGRFPEWTPAMLEGGASLPGSVRAVARYRLADAARICNLDDPKQLLALGLRPSDVVSRDYARSRAWQCAFTDRDGGPECAGGPIMTRGGQVLAYGTCGGLRLERLLR